MILGRDWLKQKGVRLYFDLGYLRIGKTYVRLEEDIHISSLLRLCKQTTLAPNSVTICKVKVNQGFRTENSKLADITPLDDGHLSEEPGIVVFSAVAKLSDSRKIPIMLINQTNKHFKLKRGEVMGRGEGVKTQNISTLNVNKDQLVKESSLSSNLNVAPEHRETVEQIIKRSLDLFAERDSDLGHTDTVKMKIETGNHPPIKKRPYRIPLLKREIVDKSVKEMMEAGVIERSRSPWAFPLVFGDKERWHHSAMRDYRSLNNIISKISYPLPLIDDILSLLGGSKWFTCLDLKSGYYQVLMDEESKEKTVFTCHKGLFQFNVMPFGISTARSLFQELAYIVFKTVKALRLRI
ncbi:Hypothetical predicted protein [Mytilus galloprovincialis]|uniref:Reverse transcriptase domain-containing protein n=1 Tax=Mytilus galloprovincialis TaxID=29158 RepID=A0A8B6EMC8_MYTGA|nr:Hypothetical predicted protein [Mytilus galloprovincialis]